MYLFSIHFCNTLIVIIYNCIQTFGQPSIIIGNKLPEFSRQTCRETTTNDLNGFIMFNTVYDPLSYTTT